MTIRSGCPDRILRRKTHCQAALSIIALPFWVMLIQHSKRVESSSQQYTTSLSEVGAKTLKNVFYADFQIKKLVMVK